MSDIGPGLTVLAANKGFEPPGPQDFVLRDVFYGNQVLLTKISLLLVLGAILAFLFLRLTARTAAVVPSKGQYLGEQAYSFIRNGIAQDSIGGDYLRYTPLLVSLFFFIVFNTCSAWSRSCSSPRSPGSASPTVWPRWSGSPTTSRVSPGTASAVTSNTCVPKGVPIAILPLLVVLEFASNIIVRPVTLSLRLFANMFAGHLLLLLFASGAEYMLIHATGNIISSRPVSPLSSSASPSDCSNSSWRSCRLTCSPC